MALLLKFFAFGSVALLVLSIYPGVLSDVIFLGILLFPLWLPALGIGGLILLLVQDRRAGKEPAEPDLDLSDEVPSIGKEPISRRQGIISAPAIVVLSLALILVGIPRRVAFLLSRPAFQRYVSMAPACEYRGVVLGRLLGFYYIDRYGTDPRGGAYFRTHTGPDGIGPDQMSYGFAFRPNREGTPFGNAHYRCTRMVGDWYVFSASNDW